MYIRLLIIVALAGFLSAETTTTTTEPTTTTTEPTTTTTRATTTTTRPTTTTSRAVTTSTEAATTSARPTRRPRPHQDHHNHHLLPPHVRPGPHPHRRPEIPGLPIVSGIIGAFKDVAESFIPRPRGGPGGRGPPRLPRAVRDFLNGANSSGQNQSNAAGGSVNASFQIPNPDDVIPAIPDLSNITDFEIPEMPDLQSLPPIPGLQDAMDQAREMAANDINAKQDLVSGIQEAMADGLSSQNPTEAMRRLISTILNAYLAVARHCPLLIIGGYVLHEGLSLSATILRVLADISGQIQDAQ